MKHSRAITLTEAILVILIIGTIMACLAPYLKGIQDFWIFTDRQTAILQGARDAMNKMIKTLKAAHSITDIDPSGRGTYLALTNYLDEPIVYFHNIESSPYYIGNTGNIKIGDLVMQTKDPSNNTVNNLLCQSLDSITFTYIKPSMDRSDPATSPDQVQAVRILFYAKDPDQTTDIRLPMSCLAYLMNVKAARGGGSWAKVIGGDRGDYGVSVYETPDGGYIIGGYTYSFGAGKNDAYLIKMDSSGNIQWSKIFGTADEEYLNSMQQTLDGGYVLGGYARHLRDIGKPYKYWRDEAYIVKTDSSGNREWSKLFWSGPAGSPAEFGQLTHTVPRSLQQTSDGGYIITGDRRYNRLLGGPYAAVTPAYDAYLIKITSSGVPEWSKVFQGSETNELGMKVAQTADDGYIITGSIRPYREYIPDVVTPPTYSDAYVIKTYASGSLDWSKSFGGWDDDGTNSIQQTSDGGYILAGKTRSFGGMVWDAYVVKIQPDTLGEHEWSKTFGARPISPGTYYDTSNSIEQASDGGYIIAGQTDGFGAGGNSDMYLIKTDASGAHQWSKIFGGASGASTENAYHVQQTSDGGYIIIGFTDSFGAVGADIYIVKTDSQGSCPEAAAPERISDAPTRWPDTPDLYKLNPVIDASLPVDDLAVPVYDPGEPTP